jgi:hypothetical protein
MYCQPRPATISGVEDVLDPLSRLEGRLDDHPYSDE